MTKSGQRAWPADKVERRRVTDLIPYARNARTHSDEQVAQIAAAIREWGWTVAVLVDEDGGIIAGHGRVLAAHKLKISEVPTIVAAGWTEAQKRAYVIADNKLTTNAGWDTELLKLELQDLKALGADLELTGFDPAELDTLMLAAPENASLDGLDHIGQKPFEQLTIITMAGTADDLRARLKEVAKHAPPEEEAPDGWALEEVLTAYERSSRR